MTSLEFLLADEFAPQIMNEGGFDVHQQYKELYRQDAMFN
jgi:hypothetical protein